jgi:hypothetical protein
MPCVAADIFELTSGQFLECRHIDRLSFRRIKLYVFYWDCIDETPSRIVKFSPDAFSVSYFNVANIVYAVEILKIVQINVEQALEKIFAPVVGSYKALGHIVKTSVLERNSAGIKTIAQEM